MGEKALYVDRTAFRHTDSGDMTRFSRYLELELDTLLSNFFVLDTDMTKADFVLEASFRPWQSGVRGFLKYFPPVESSHKSLAYTISFSSIPEDFFEQGVEEKANRLAAEIVKFPA